MDVDAEIDRLYRGPLDAFVAARDALAKRLRAEDRATADAVKQRRRPPVAIWAVNQLYWQHRALVRRLLAAGDAVRKEQAARSSPDSVADAVAAQREVVTEALDRARKILEEAGYSADAHLDVVRRTLAAMSAWGDDLPVRSGRLDAEVEPPGFEVLLAGLDRGAPRATPPRTPSRKPAEAPKKPAEPPKKPAEPPKPPGPDSKALRALAAAAEEVERLEAASREAAEQAEKAEQREQEARTRSDAARKELRDAERAERDAVASATQAREATNNAQKALAKARRGVEALRGTP
jgi:hypothetical protein